MNEAMGSYGQTILDEAKASFTERLVKRLEESVLVRDEVYRKFKTDEKSIEEIAKRLEAEVRSKLPDLIELGLKNDPVVSKIVSTPKIANVKWFKAYAGLIGPQVQAMVEVEVSAILKDEPWLEKSKDFASDAVSAAINDANQHGRIVVRVPWTHESHPTSTVWRKKSGKGGVEEELLVSMLVSIEVAAPPKRGYR